jgi:hypothetical protein
VPPRDQRNHEYVHLQVVGRVVAGRRLVAELEAKIVVDFVTERETEAVVDVSEQSLESTLPASSNPAVIRASATMQDEYSRRSKLPSFSITRNNGSAMAIVAAAGVTPAVGVAPDDRPGPPFKGHANTLLRDLLELDRE